MPVSWGSSEGAPSFSVTLLHIVAFKDPILYVFITPPPNRKDPFQRLENHLEAEPDSLVFILQSVSGASCLSVIEKITYRLRLYFLLAFCILIFCLTVN